MTDHEMLELLVQEVRNLNTSIGSIGGEVRTINLTIENRIFPGLESLSEGQKTILETLAPRSRVEALEEEVEFMKSVIKALSKEVAELKKAQ